MIICMYYIYIKNYIIAAIRFIKGGKYFKQTNQILITNQVVPEVIHLKFNRSTKYCLNISIYPKDQVTNEKKLDMSLKC